MPAITLIVCVCGERELFQRLVEQAQGSYDELLVIHDGPDQRNIRQIAERVGGRFLEMPRAYQQEQHWSYAFATAKHDWIFRMDPDEYPSAPLNQWLQAFRTAPEPDSSVAGYFCIWPMWNGKRTVTSDWPNDRRFLFHRYRVHCIGMPECVPMAEPGTRFDHLPLVLEHRPPYPRKTYGVWNTFFRKRTWKWSRQIAATLMGSPLATPCWRWTSSEWPPFWEKMRRHPLRTGVGGGCRTMLMNMARAIKRGHWPHPAYWLFPHHIQFGLSLAWEKMRRRYGWGKSDS